MPPIVQLLFAILLIGAVCYLSIKLILPLCLKIIDFGSNSPRLQKLVPPLSALFFGAMGIWMLKGFLDGMVTRLSQFFPLPLFLSLFFLYLTFSKRKSKQ